MSQAKEGLEHNRWRTVLGHVHTLGPRLRHTVKPYSEPPSRPWEVSIPNDLGDTIGLSGRFSKGPNQRVLALMLHGLGGSASSHYMRMAATQVAACELPCLRLNLRGVGDSSPDLYHAGLTADVHHVLHDPFFEAYESVYLLGFSLGGHLALKYACEDPHPRVKAVAACSSPLDLLGCARWLDSRRCWAYRLYLMNALKRTYRRITAQPNCPAPKQSLKSVHRIETFDDVVVAPRFGFENALDYYRTQSAGPRLADLRRPALLFNSLVDPMVPAKTIFPFEGSSQALTIAWTRRGGHVTFPRSIDVGLSSTPGAVSQILSWCHQVA